MAVEAVLPQLSTILLTAAIDSINPCAIGVLILLLSTLVSTSQTKKQLLRMGFIYISAVYVVYFSAGLGLTLFLSYIPLIVSSLISILVGLVIIAMALIEIKDFYWYGQGFSLMIPGDKAKEIHKLAKNITVPGMIFLG